VAHSGYADDYAFLVWGLTELYECVFEVRYLEAALELQESMLDLFWDDRTGGFNYTPRDCEGLIVRDKEIYDGAIPSSNSVAALNLLRLSRMTGKTDWDEKADLLLRAFAGMVSDYPSAYTQFLHAVDFAVGPSQEIVIAGDLESEETQAMVEAVHQAFMPRRVLMLKTSRDGERLVALSPFLRDLHPMDGKPTVYICENHACKKPVTSLGELKSVLGGRVAPLG
jgi:uncharacterized protein YyaL (SSP411 family)